MGEQQRLLILIDVERLKSEHINAGQQLPSVDLILDQEILQIRD